MQSVRAKMPSRAFRAAAALSLLALAAPALAQFVASAPGRDYGAVHGGINLVDRWPAEVNFNGATTGGSLKLDRSLHFGVIAGREQDRTRFEIEYQNGRAKVDGVSLGPVSQGASGTARYQALTLNAYRTFQLTNEWNAFLGVGIGWGRAELPQLAPVNGCNCFRDASDTGLVLQARIGAEYQLGPDQFVTGQLTALRLPGPDSGTAPGVKYANKWLGALSVGYRQRF